MNVFTLPNVLLAVSASSILLAISLAGGSLSKSVKWNFYNSGTDYGYPGSPVVKLYAYQNLWTSYDAWNGTHDTKHGQVYELIKQDYWRPLPRLLIQISLGIGGASLVTLLITSLVPVLKRKSFVINSGRIASSFLSIATGTILAYTLDYYEKHYRSMLAPTYYDKTSYYPHEDNVSTGFFMTGTACALTFISAIVNIVNVVMFIKDRKTAVKPNDKNDVVPGDV